MSVKIRLTRLGAKKKPFYRIVIATSTSPRDGKFIEIVGTYDPMLAKENENRIKLKQVFPKLMKELKNRNIKSKSLDNN